MFSTQSKTEIIILATVNLSSANALNLDQSRILWFGKELNLSQIAMIRHSKFKRSPMDKYDTGTNLELKVSDNDSVKNTVFEHILLSECLSHYHTMPHFDALQIYSFGKHLEKRKNCL